MELPIKSIIEMKVEEVVNQIKMGISIGQNIVMI